VDVIYLVLWDNLVVFLFFIQSIKSFHLSSAAELGIGQVNALGTIWSKAHEGVLASKIGLILSEVAALLVNNIPMYSLG
jgi:hypothetical protein